MASSLDASSVNFAIDMLQRADANRVILDIDGGPLVYGFLSADFEYSLGNSWESLFESFGGATTVGALVGLIGSSLMQTRQFILRNLNQTVAQWTGSEKFPLALPFLFMALTPDDDVRPPIAALQTLSLPTRGGNVNLGSSTLGKIAALGLNNLIGETTLTAPNGYGGNEFNCYGAVGVSIGSWFQTPRWFIVKSLTPGFSKATTSNGTPLYSTCLVTMESYRLLTADEVNGFFTDMDTGSSSYLDYTGNPLGTLDSRLR